MTKKERQWRKRLQSETYGLCMIDDFDSNEIDGEIFTLVLLLRDNKFQTIGSSQGHTSPIGVRYRPYVSMLPDIGDKTYIKTFNRLTRFLRRNGITEYEVELKTSYSDSDERVCAGIPIITVYLPYFAPIPQFQKVWIP